MHSKGKRFRCFLLVMSKPWLCVNYHDVIQKQKFQQFHFFLHSCFKVPAAFPKENQYTFPGGNGEPFPIANREDLGEIQVRISPRYSCYTKGADFKEIR